MSHAVLTSQRTASFVVTAVKTLKLYIINLNCHYINLNKTNFLSNPISISWVAYFVYIFGIRRQQLTSFRLAASMVPNRVGASLALLEEGNKSSIRNVELHLLVFRIPDDIQILEAQ
jgi:hypothetical protein